MKNPLFNPFKNMKYLTVETDETEPKRIAHISANADAEGIHFFQEDGYRIRCAWKNFSEVKVERQKKYLWLALLWILLAAFMAHTAFTTDSLLIAMVAGWDMIFAVNDLEKYTDPNKGED